MADFCHDCSMDHFGEDFRDLAGFGDTKPGVGWTACCEGCGNTIVDGEGRCRSMWCPLHGWTVQCSRCRYRDLGPGTDHGDVGHCPDPDCEEVPAVLVPRAWMDDP